MRGDTWGRGGSGRGPLPSRLSFSLPAFAVCGFLLSLSFPKENLWPVAWFVLAPAFWLLDRQRGLVGAALGGLAFGVGLFSKLLFWLNLFGPPAYLLVVLFQSAFYALAFLLGKLAGGGLPSGLLRGPTYATAFCVVGEWLRAQGPFGFTWGMVAQSQYKAVFLLQGCALIGPFGLSLAIAVANGLLAGGALSGRLGEARTGLISWAFLFAFLSVLGDFGDLPEGRKLKVTVVQGRAEQRLESRRFIYGAPVVPDYERMSLTHAKGAGLLVWPETALPGPIAGPRARPDLVALVRRVARSTGAWLLVGAPEIDRWGRIFNSVHLISPDGKLAATYRKVHLVPFGEYVPGGGRLRRWLKRFGVREFDFSRGPGFRPLEADGLFSVGVAICFESAFPYIARRLVSEGAEFLAVLTNDSWFDRTAAPEQHLAFSVLMAASTRRYVVRAATTGISAIIHPRGFIIREAALYEPRALRAAVRREEWLTPYVKLGDWPVLLAFFWLLLASLLLWLLPPGRRRRG